MYFILKWIFAIFAVLLISYLLNGVSIQGTFAAIIVVILLGFANIIVRPILLIVTLPINILTLGLFTFVINALIVLLVGALVPGFIVENFWWALLFSVSMSIVMWVVRKMLK